MYIMHTPALPTKVRYKATANSVVALGPGSTAIVSLKYSVVLKIGASEEFSAKIPRATEEFSAKIPRATEEFSAKISRATEEFSAKIP